MKSSPQLVSLENAPLQIIDGDRGIHYPKQHEFSEVGYCLFLNAGNVTKFGFDFDTCQFVNESKDRLLRKGRLCREDIVMTTRGTLGNMAYYSAGIEFENIRINSGMVLIRADKIELRPNYLYCALRSSLVSDQINQLKSGVAQPQLPIRDLKKIKIPIPAPDAQERIANVMGTYDNLIANNTRRIELLERSAQLLFEEWFVRFRYPGHEHDNIVDGVPEGWSRERIEDVADTIGGGTPSTAVPEYWNSADITWFVPTDITNNDCLVLLASERKISESGLRNSSAKIVPRGSILMTSRASVGFFGIYDEGDCCTNQGFIVISPKIPYARMLMLHDLMRRKEEIVGRAGGVTYKEINKTTFRNMTMLIPSEKARRPFEEFCQDVFRQVRTLKRQSERATQARDLLLTRLMDGRIEV